MKLFTCSSCDQIVYFENSECMSCGHALAYVSELGELATLEPAPNAPEGTFVALGGALKGGQVRMCANQLTYGVCNWAMPAADPHPLCQSCRLNDVIPDLSDPASMTAWVELEQAKRRLVYQLLALRLPVDPRAEVPGGLAFAFKQDVPGEEKVLIGQHSGLITLNVAEASSPFLEKTRVSLGESYRTLLGHFRHEIGHYYFERLVLGSPFEGAFRDLFGDESASYEDALETHYSGGPPADWQARYVSSYATMHPHEDWAESWAHCLHMLDTLETARSFGLEIRSNVAKGARALEVETTRVDADDFEALRKAWVPLTIALNGLNRSMGLRDLYPFILSEPALRKLRFVHRVIHESRGAR